MLDIIDWEILSILQENGRISYSEIGRQVNLTSPAVAERMRKLEEAEVITGYHAMVNSEILGYPITCFVHLIMAPGDIVKCCGSTILSGDLHRH